MQTPIEQVAALTVGTVESVSPSEIRVLLETDAPQATALNTGTPTGFPRINSYLLIPNESGAVVGMISWLGVERSAFPRRTGMKDFGVIDLPFPLRKLYLTPLGTLVCVEKDGQEHYELRRGVSVFPSVADPVLLPTRQQLRSIVEAATDEDRRVTIGTSPLAANARVTVDPNKVFGRHLAVLGNTGSGKSCSVAGLIRWSLQQAAAARQDGSPVNARFILLDPNGEYSAAFADFPNTRRFRVPPIDAGTARIVLPAWLWNSQEWCAFSHAAPGAQRPLLLQALRELRAGRVLAEPVEWRVRRVCHSYKMAIEGLVAQGLAGYGQFPACKNCGTLLANMVTDLEQYLALTSGGLGAALGTLRSTVEATVKRRYWRSANGEGFNAFGEADLMAVLDKTDEMLRAIPGPDPLAQPISEDAPIPFALEALPDHLEHIATHTPGGDTARFIHTLCTRIRLMLAEQRLAPVVNPDGGEPVCLDGWLETYIGASEASNGQLAILDLSLMPSDVLHMVIAVIARLVFEACQRYRRSEGEELPTVLVLEEAHSFVQRGSDVEEGHPTPSQMCRHTFERIAREGRKFGLGLVLSSQRPSELSPTVLAQCNTFLLHRIVNDRDQELVGRLVPDNLGGLLGELPSLPTRQAILLGWAATVPTLVEVTELPVEQRPHSSDPKFWEVWTGMQERTVDWRSIAAEWSGVGEKAE